MSKLNKIALVVFRSFATPLFGFSLSLLGIKYYQKENWGEFIQLFTWILLVAFLTGFGNKDYLIRKYSSNPSKIAMFFTENISTRVVLLVISLLFFFFFPVKIATASVILVVLLFVYQSLDSLVVYHQFFLRQIISEILGFSVIAIYFYLENTFNLIYIIAIYCLAYFLKISILFLKLNQFFSLKHSKFLWVELKNSLSFFLIIFSGFIASKIDLYVVNVSLPKETISEYQIGITAFLLLQSLSYLIILPFNKHLYRLNLKSIQKIKNVLYSIAFPLVLFGSLCIWFVLENSIDLNLPLEFYIVGGFSSIPTFFFIVDVIQYYRQNKERIILKINLIAALINLILTLLLINKFGIVGALLSVLVTQVVVLIFYKTAWIK